MYPVHDDLVFQLRQVRLDEEDPELLGDIERQLDRLYTRTSLREQKYNVWISDSYRGPTKVVFAPQDDPLRFEYAELNSGVWVNDFLTQRRKDESSTDLLSLSSGCLTSSAGAGALLFAYEVVRETHYRGMQLSEEMATACVAFSAFGTLTLAFSALVMYLGVKGERPNWRTTLLTAQYEQDPVGALEEAFIHSYTR